MSATAAQSQANMQTASRNVREAMGLPEDRTLWTYEQRNAYLQQLSEYVLRFPGSFTPETLATAQNIAGKTFQPLQDPSFDWAQFGVEAVRPAGAALQSVGDGVLTTLRATGWAIPVGVVALVLWIVLSSSSAPKVARNVRKVIGK